MKRQKISIKLIALTLVLSLAVCLAPASIASGDAVVPEEDAIAENVTKGVFYDTLEDALANAGEDENVVLLHSYELQDSIVIGDFVQLTIPTAENGTEDTILGNNTGDKSVNLNGKAAVTLTVPEGKSITVSGGTLLVAGNQQSNQPKTGFLYGDYGAIELNGTMKLENYAYLYARGNITGSGSISVDSTSHVYERFEISDWRGGSASTKAAARLIFPFSLYELASIAVDATYDIGATLYGMAFIYASDSPINIYIHYFADDGLIRPVENTGSVTLDPTVGEDGKIANTNVIVNANVTTGDLKFDEAVSGQHYPLDSSLMVCPFGYKVDVDIREGGKVTVDTRLKVMPGCDINVNNGGNLTISHRGSLLFYMGANYLPTFNFAGWSTTENATLTNSGTVTVEAGGFLQRDGMLGTTSTTFTDNIVGTQYSNNNTFDIHEYLTSGDTQTVTFYTYTA